MPAKSQQKIAVFLSFDGNDKGLILWGVKLAVLFRKELCLVYLLKKEKEKARCNAVLAGYMAVVNNELPDLNTSTMLLDSSLVNAPSLLADNYEVILIVTHGSGFKKYLKSLSGSPVPFFFTGNSLPEANLIKKIMVPVDLRKANNEAGIWASYFGRFNQSEIHLLAANDTERDNSKQVSRNVHYINNILSKFSIPSKVFRGKKGSFGIQMEALEVARETASDLLITTASSKITIIDIIIGLPELKILQAAGKMPLLLINPRKDMYVMCD